MVNFLLIYFVLFLLIHGGTSVIYGSLVSIVEICADKNCFPATSSLRLNIPSSIKLSVVQIPADNSTAEQNLADLNNWERRAFLCSLNNGIFLPCDPHDVRPGAFRL